MSLRITILLGGIALAGSSCAAEETESRRSALGSAPGLHDAPLAKPDPAAIYGAKRGQHELVPPTVTRPDIEDAATEQMPALSRPLAKTQRDALAASPVPVLLPDADIPWERGTFTVRAAFYAATVNLPGHSIYVQGTRTVHEHAEVELSAAGDALTRRSYIVSRTHQIVTVAFERFGIGYHIDVECSAPMDDPRCTEDAYAIELVSSLAIAAPWAGGGR